MDEPWHPKSIMACAWLPSQSLITAYAALLIRIDPNAAAAAAGGGGGAPESENLADKLQISVPSLVHNSKIVENVRGTLSIVSGAATGIMGATGFQVRSRTAGAAWRVRESSAEGLMMSYGLELCAGFGAIPRAVSDHVAGPDTQDEGGRGEIPAYLVVQLPGCGRGEPRAVVHAVLDDAVHLDIHLLISR